MVHERRDFPDENYWNHSGCSYEKCLRKANLISTLDAVTNYKELLVFDFHKVVLTCTPLPCLTLVASSILVNNLDKLYFVKLYSPVWSEG